MLATLTMTINNRFKDTTFIMYIIPLMYIYVNV